MGLYRLLFIGCFVSLGLMGCGPLFDPSADLRHDLSTDPAAAADPAAPVTLTVSAAASLQTVLTGLSASFEAAYPHIHLLYNWGGSGTLQQQIEQGAPSDLFFSAGSLQMDALEKKGLIRPGSRRDLLSNRLVLIAPLDSTLSGFGDLAPATSAGPGPTLAVGDFRAVPAGQYAEATLTHFHLLPEIAPQLIFFSNVRGVLAAVEGGHAAAGMVYQSDAALSGRVKVLATAPTGSHPPIRYPIGILTRSRQPAAAADYLEFLVAPTAKQAFEQAGFIPLAGSLTP